MSWQLVDHGRYETRRNAVMPVDANRDYLLGVLAVQSGFIESARMRELLSQVGGESALRMADLLREGSFVNEQQLADLDGQVCRLLGERPAQKPAAVQPPADGSQVQPFTDQDDLDLTVVRDPNSTSESASQKEMAPAADRRDAYVSLETVAWNSASRSRYTLTREHGRGGLGCVWLARDSILNREVALKEVLPAKAHKESRLKSLVREAQITGQLEHPNIVPVYELSSHDGDARPFYTMRFLRGQTLHQRIREYRKRRQAGEADALELRELLDAFISVCHALGYAHSRGIIHRDLKPSNILLGDFGEVIVVDWGLAKLLSDPRDKDVDMQQVAFTDPDSHTCTREGQALGTPAFMAPEQARGQISLTDELTDIYGLGAILFNILSGKPPHLTTRPAKSKDNTQELLKRICTLETPLVRSVDPSIPQSLEAICGKAMARLRSDRYATADELARDVQRWLADEPVTAYSEKPVERMFRWLRKHRTYSLAMAAVLLVISIAGVTIAVVTTTAKNKVAQSLQKEQESHNAAIMALDAEQQAKKLALQQFRRAQDAIDRASSGVSEIVTVFPGTESLRSELLRSAAAEYEGLLDVDGSDSELRREAARTRIRLADLRRLMNDFTAAEKQYLRAEQDFKSLQSEQESDPSWNLDLAEVWSKLALLYTADGKHSDAEKFFSQAIKAYEQPFADPALQLEAQLGRSDTRVNHAALLRGEGRSNDAIDLLSKAAQEYQTLLLDNDDHRVREGLAMSDRELGLLLQSLGKNEQAVEKLREAEAQYKRLIAKNDDPSYIEGLAHTRMLLANAQRLLGDDLAPMRIYQLSVDDYLALLKVRPGIPSYRQSVAAGRVNIAQMLYKSARSRDAKVYLDDAVAELIDLSQTYPQVSFYREAKAQCLITLAMVLRDLDDDERAEAAFMGGADEFRWLHEDFPDLVHYRGDLGISLMGWARQREKQGETEAAESLYKEAIRELTLVVNEQSQAVRYQDALAWCHDYLGELLAGEQKTAVATTHFAQALRIREALPDLPEFRRALIRLLSECSIAELRDAKRAIALGIELCEQEGQNPDFHYSLAVAYLADDDQQNALKEAQSAVQLRADSNPFDLFVLAIAEHQNGEDEASNTLAQAEELMQVQCPGRIELIAWQKKAINLIRPGNPAE